uniref:Uncharacterized protein n=1 Tax=Leersia perrieri TaxID=77586 RepID=A0A0D9XTB7_9ORYZ
MPNLRHKSHSVAHASSMLSAASEPVRSEGEKDVINEDSSLPLSVAGDGSIPEAQAEKVTSPLAAQEGLVADEADQNAVMQPETVQKCYRAAADTLFLLTCWLLWKERNARVFDHIARTVDNLVEQIKEEIVMWTKAGLFLAPE